MDTEILTLPVGLVNALHEYLTQRPMREVEHLVVALRQARPVETPTEET